jgi:putative intracellular protease/amidase
MPPPFAPPTVPNLIVLCAGYDPLAHVTPRVRAFLSRANRADTMIGGADTGTVILAELGLLDGYQAVLHFEAVGRISRELARHCPERSDLLSGQAAIDSSRWNCDRRCRSGLVATRIWRRFCGSDYRGHVSWGDAEGRRKSEALIFNRSCSSPHEVIDERPPGSAFQIGTDLPSSQRQ